MSSRFTVDQLHVSSCRVYYDEHKTRVKESTNLLQYESQHFRCKVDLQFSDSVADNHWSIGLVQACDRMYLENRYGDLGSSFWEFHPLRSGRHKMVNDSDGRQYPFYSLSSSKCEVRKGSVQESTISLHYEDHFYPTVAWTLPYCGGAHLTDVIRKQDFWIWLVAIKRGGAKANSSSGSYEYFNVKNDRLYVLKTMRWRFNLHMKFDPHQPVGQRLKKLYDIQDEAPCVLEQDRTVPLSAISPPHCNAAQSLVWYPKNTLEKPRILVPPRQTICTWDAWIRDMLPHLSPLVPPSSTIQKPKEFTVVGEWSKDEEIGISASLSRRRPRLQGSLPSLPCSSPLTHIPRSVRPKSFNKEPQAVAISQRYSASTASSRRRESISSSRSLSSRPRHIPVDNNLDIIQGNLKPRQRHPNTWEGDYGP